MKQFVYAALAAAVLSTGVAHASNTISFEGEISPTTCDVTLNDNDSGTGTVIIPVHPSVADLTKGKTAARTDFVIHLKNCDIGNPVQGDSVYAYFEPSDAGSVDANSGLLNNLTTDGTEAKNVRLQLLDSASGDAIKVGDISQSTNTTQVIIGGTDEDGKGGTADLYYAVQFIADAAADATAGQVTGKVNYEISYQ